MYVHDSTSLVNPILMQQILKGKCCACRNSVHQLHREITGACRDAAKPGNIMLQYLRIILLSSAYLTVTYA